MNAYLRAVFAGKTASIEDWHEHLILFHRTFPDATPRALATFRAQDGTDAYRYFAARLHELAPSPHSILDIGCGEGSLLLAMREIFGARTRLAGIDLSDSEITRARERVPEAELCCGDVAKVEYPPAAFGAVVGHLSFALIPNLRGVFRSITKMLRDEGILAFVIEDPLSDSTIFRAIAASMAPIRRRFPAFAPLVPQREVCEDDEVLRALLREAGFSNEPLIERFRLEARLTPDALWQFARVSYPLGLLPADLQDVIRAAVHDAAPREEEDGRVAAVLPLRMIACVKPSKNSAS